MGAFFVCLLTLFPELFFFPNPPWLQGLQQNLPSVLYFLFSHICGFLVNQLPKLYQELVKDFTYFCCWPTHGLHMQWNFMGSVCLEESWNIGLSLAITWALWRMNRGGNNRGAEGTQHPKWMETKTLFPMYLWSCVSTVAAQCIILRLVVFVVEAEWSLSCKDLRPPSPENVRAARKLGNALRKHQSAVYTKGSSLICLQEISII